jgi:dipeptidyl aminopeptidase/acylaminoacyl peptidase
MSPTFLPGRLALQAAAFLLLGLALAMPSTIGARQLRAVTIDALLAAPFTSEIAAARTGAKVAWVSNEQGARNVWIAEGPAFSGRRLTAFRDDDGQDITSLAFTSDAASVVYARGGGANRAGENPNPTSHPDGAEQAVWVVAVSGGAPRKIGTGGAPAMAPKGDLVAFLQRGQIWMAGASGTPAASQAAKIRGGARSLSWSPDGTRLAFSSSRGTHAFIGILDVATKAVSWLQPSLDNDDVPAWSPDGTRVAFVRTPTVRDLLPFFPQRQGHPWGLWVADVKSGAATEVWRAAEGRGSVFQAGDVRTPLVWSAGDRLVFPWERDGWHHLYSMPASGGAPVLLTPGEFEIDGVSYSADGRTAVVSSNQGDIDRRHLWRVATGGGGAPEALTSGTGLEWHPALMADGTSVAFVKGDARRPGQPALLTRAGPARELASGVVPATFPAQALVEPQSVTITAADGMQIPAQLFRPAGPPPSGAKRPALVFIHGGSRRQMLLGWHYLAYYHNTYAFNQFMASKGYVVLSVNYRSGTGYGLEFREALDYGATGASEYNDVIGAGLYLARHPDVDASRIAVWGGSYGGYLTAMALARASGMFAAGVDIHGVHDWNHGIRNFVPGYDPVARPDVARRAFASSPMAFLDGWRSPVLLVHGDDDRNVAFSESVELIEQLRARKVHVEQLVFPDEVHGFLLHRNWQKVFTVAADFLDRQLAPKRSASQP